MPQKPTSTVPELLRKKSEGKAKLDQLSREFVKEGRTVTDDEFKQLEDLSHEVREGGTFDLQIEARKRWDTIDGALAGAQTAKGRETEPLPHEDHQNTRNGHYDYSMLAAMRAAYDPRKFPLQGLELEVDQELRKRRLLDGMPRKAEGVQIPLNLPINLSQSYRWAQRSGVGKQILKRMRDDRRMLAEERALDTTAGGGGIPTILDATMIEILRARMVTYNLGARVMTDMQGLFAIPRQSAASTFYMVGQGSPVTASNQTIDQVPFSPHTGGVMTQWTRQFLEQTNQDAEMLVREDQSAVVARGVETQAFNGQGSGGYPLGIIPDPEIGVYPIGTNGGAPTWTQLVSQEAYVAYFNADVGSLAYVTDALTRGTLKLTTKVASSTFPIYLWNTEAPDFPVNGYPCAITNLLPQNLGKGNASNLHAMIFANWEDLIYAFWSGMDVILDPYTAAPQGSVNLITLQDFDVNKRHYQSFANCVDIVSSITAPVI